MLGRLLLAIGDARLRARLRRSAARADMLVESVENPEQIWERLAQHASDILVVSRTMLPEPAAESVASFRGLPDSPEVVVLDDARDAEDRARLIAAGCYAVLEADLSSTA